MDDSAPTQHIFHASVSTKKPETAVISGLQLVEATGVEPVSENNQSRLLHAYPEL